MLAAYRAPGLRVPLHLAAYALIVLKPFVAAPKPITLMNEETNVSNRDPHEHGLRARAVHAGCDLAWVQPPCPQGLGNVSVVFSISGGVTCLLSHAMLVAALNLLH